jgi:diaminopimelate decarboxylase
MFTQSPFHYQDNTLYCEEVPLAEIASAVQTPVYVYSQAELLRRANAYRTAAPANSLVCYAVKANGNPELLRLLAAAGLGADVTSGGELFLARHAGFPPDRILFSGVGKSRPEIEAAVTIGIRALHVESEMELAVIADVAAQLGRVVSIAVRVNPNVQADTHPHISTGQYIHKFGVTMDQASNLLRFAADHPWLQPVGLAAHIGSQITDLEPFVEEARFLVTAANDLAEVGIRLQYIDVGGGLGIRYANADVPEPADWVAAVASPIVEAGYQLVVEPGRSIVGPAGALLTGVIYTKKQGDKTFLISDAGMTELIRPALYSAHHPIQPVQQPAGNSPLNPVDIVGPVCETGDHLARERPFPPTRPGDLLAVLQAGAYGFAMSSNYNGRVKAAEVLVDGSHFYVIRKRQSYAHLLDGWQTVTK